MYMEPLCLQKQSDPIHFLYSNNNLLEWFSLLHSTRAHTFPHSIYLHVHIIIRGFTHIINLYYSHNRTGVVATKVHAVWLQNHTGKK